MADMRTIKIRLSSYDYNLLDQSVQIIVGIARSTGAVVNGPIPLPTNNKKLTLLASPHVDKNARNQIEIRRHNRYLVVIIDESSNTVDALMKSNLAAGVEVSIL